MSAREFIALTADPGSFVSWDAPPEHGEVEPGYGAELRAAAEASGVDEAVLTGEARIGGHPVALVVSEFGFLAGSIGVATARRLILAIERATALGLPLLAAPASGGTRMQEGTLAFVQMIGVSAAVTAHKAAGLPYLVYLRDPTTGGVLASWGSLGQLTLAQPAALVGFLGPRVYTALYGGEFPAGVQTAENLAAHGLVDGVVAPGELAGLLARTLRVLCAPRTAAGVAVPEPGPAGRPGRLPRPEGLHRAVRRRVPGRR
ncbi:MAG TPA: acetyl-CoA carboxylase carboxyltransferase subunit beta, partial [Actinomycetota bacterium]